MIGSWLLFCIASHIALPTITLLKAIAIRLLFEQERATTIAFAIVGRAITLERKPSKKKQRIDTKKDAKRIKGDNFTRSNRENSK